MQNLKEKYENLNACKDFEELWEVFFAELKELGFSSVAFGTGYSATPFLESKLGRKVFNTVTNNWLGCKIAEITHTSGFIKTNHPKEYLAYFDENFGVFDDICAIHCAFEVTPLFWHDEESWLPLVNERQNAFMQDSKKFGMGVGVSIPLRFVKGYGGAGLCFSGSEKEFAEMWQRSEKQIMELLYSFDFFVRQEAKNSQFLLSKEQQTLLRQIAKSDDEKALAQTLELDSKIVHLEMQKIRKKLKVENNVQAIMKSRHFNLIEF